MDLNQLARGTEAAGEGGYARHPLGYHDGVVEDIKERKIREGTMDECPLWDVKIRTAEGTARHTIWGFSQNDMQKINTEQAAANQAMDRIKRIKRTYINLGVWPEDGVEAREWSGGPGTILGDMHQLIGKQCQINVEASTKKAGEVVVWINAPVEGAQVQQQPAQQQSNGGAQQPVQQNTQPAGSVGGLSDIPF